MRPMSANKRPIETRTHLNWFRCCPPRVGQNQSSTHHVIQKHLRATFTDKKKNNCAIFVSLHSLFVGA